MDFISEEMNTTERAAFEALRKNPNITPEEAARIVREQYERPDPAVANDAYRQQVAREVYDGRSVRPMQRSMQNSLNDFAEDVKQAAPEEANLNFMKDPVKDITPEELSNKLKSREIEPEFRSYDVSEYNRINKMQEGEKISYATEETKSLKSGIKDAQGDTVKIVFDEANQNAIDDVVNHLIRGSKGGTISSKRVLATHLIRDTVEHPDVTVLQKNGRKAHIGFWKGPDNITHEVIVSLDKADKGKIITSFVASDSMHKPNKAFNKLISDIKKADTILDVGDNIRARLLEYPRPAASDRVSAPDTRLHPSGNSIVAEEAGKVKLPGDERSFMVKPVEEAAGSDLTTWQGETISRKQILDDVNSIFGATIKKGRVGKKGTNGWYNPKTDIIRTRTFGDPRTVMHELGHYVDARFKFSNRPGFDTEFSNVIHKRFGNAYDKGGIKIIRKEGIAEFFHDYVTSHKKAAAEFPTFYKEFKRILDRDKDLRAAVDKMSYVGHQWYAQPVWERMKGSVSFGGKENLLQKTIKFFKDSKEVARKVYHEPYTTLVDELHPLDELIGEVEKRAERKLRVEENAFKQAWLARGWAGKAEALLQNGDKRLGVKAFKDVIRQIPENRLEDFSTYLTALRELDMNKWNEVLPLGEEPLITRFTKAECFEAIKHYEKSPVFKKAAAEIYKYSDALLHLAVEGGMLTCKSRGGYES